MLLVMPLYLIYGSNSHSDFRKEELESLAELYSIEIDLKAHDPTSPFCIVEIKDDTQAARLVSRSILVRGIYQLLGRGSSYNDLHQALLSHPQYPFPEFMDASFKFTFEAFDATRLTTDQRSAIESFSHLGWKGKIDMKHPDHVFAIIEDWSKTAESHKSPTDAAVAFKEVFFARKVASSSRHLIGKYDLKKRGYLGTTSMESELSLVSANQVLASPGKLIYDPFVGTGSFLVTCSAFGAVTLGSDIDGRQIKGKQERSIVSNFKDYELENLLLDCLVFDIKHSPWHTNFKIEGIIADPPYGVRAGAKTLGRAEGTRHFGRTDPAKTPSGTFVHERDGYIPPKKPYELSDLADDLLDYASEILLPAGRLVFWLPTVNEDYSAVDLPARSDMLLLANSTQNFGRWSRRLLTYKRLEVPHGTRAERIRTAGHADFRYKYYSRFGNGKTIQADKYDRLSEKEKEYFSRASE